jgi:hypothetical protein
MSDPVPPVGRFSPAPSIIVDRTVNSVSITGNMELYGPEATSARAATIERNVNSTWTHSFDDGYSVSCNISVRFRDKDSRAGDATQIEALKCDGPSHVTDYPLFDRSMTLNATERDAFTWTPTHEFGHILGLEDRYSESIMSSIRGTWGGVRHTVATQGYQTNLMASSGGVLEKQNVGDLASENAPSPYWINDDDQVRDWVNAHSCIEINLLSTNNKVKMFQPLVSGWISDEDVDAMTRICSSVDDTQEGKSLQKSIDLHSFSSIGQRTRMRVSFTKMPGGWIGG